MSLGPFPSSSLIPSVEKGYLPYYLLLVSTVAIGNAFQNLTTLHYTRRIYNGVFVSNLALARRSSGAANPDDSVNKLVPVNKESDEDKAKTTDQVTPLSARLFGLYTFAAGLIRLYAAYRIEDAALYQLAIWTHVIAAAHFTSEMLVFKTIRFSGPQVFPFLAAYTGMVWMGLQYGNYVEP